jgi:hypothetical protein
MRTSGLMGGFDPKTVFAIVIRPGFWLLRAAMAIALVFPTIIPGPKGFKKKKKKKKKGVFV